MSDTQKLGVMEADSPASAVMVDVQLPVTAAYTARNALNVYAVWCEENLTKVREGSEAAGVLMQLKAQCETAVRCITKGLGE